MRLLPLLATLLCLLALPAAALGAPPAVTTGPADPVGSTTATVKGTVDPNGELAPYVFEYGTTTAYGLETPEQSAGSGDEPVDVSAALTGLSPATTYHYRLVSGEVKGADATFTTAAAPVNPAIPSISSRGYTERAATSVILKARIDPNRAATTYFVEWGYTADLGLATPEQALPSGDEPVPVLIPLTGLTPNTRIYWRVVATNAAGVRRSTTLTLTTRRGPTGITARVSTDLAQWGDTVTVSGHVDGAGIGGMTVALEQATYPFTSPFAAVATARVDSNGDFSFRARQALIATRWRVVTRSTPAFTSPDAATLVRPRLSTRTVARTRAVRLNATVNPGLPGATATLQRRTDAGRWISVKRKAVTTIDVLRSTAGFTVRRRATARTFRVKVKPATAAYLPVKGTEIRVSRRPR